MFSVSIRNRPSNGVPLARFLARRSFHGLASMALGLGLPACAALPPPRPPLQPKGAAPLVLPSRRPALPVSLSLSQVADDALLARWPSGAAPGMVVDLRSFTGGTMVSAMYDASSAGVTGAGFRLPIPWNGEVRLTRPGSAGSPPESALVGIVVRPVGPRTDKAPALIHGPYGRTVVVLAGADAPATGTQVVITSPAISTPVVPAGLVGDPVEIGLLAAGPGAATGTVGVTPWSPPAKGRLRLSVFDPKAGTWSALSSTTARDGTVYAKGPLPGVYAVTVAP